MIKKILLLYFIALMPVMTFIGCKKTEELSDDPKVTEEYNISGKTITTGMRYSDIVNIIGKEGNDIGSGVVIMKWELPSDETLLIWFFPPYKTAPLNEWVAENIKLESSTD